MISIVRSLGAVISTSLMEGFRLVPKKASTIQSKNKKSNNEMPLVGQLSNQSDTITVKKNMGIDGYNRLMNYLPSKTKVE
jgi:hypothetical protein